MIAYGAAVFAPRQFIRCCSGGVCKENEEKRRTRGRKKKAGKRSLKGEKDEKSEKTKKTFIFGLILLLIGCGILLYPHILQKFYKIKTESMFRQFEETTENVRMMRILKNMPRLYEEMKNYNEELIKKQSGKSGRSVCICKPGNPFEEYRSRRWNCRIY